MFWYVQKHKISTVGASIINTDVQVFGVSSQHFPFSASLWNHRIVFHPMYVYVLWNIKINVTFEGDLKVITLFCREFWYCQNYALFVLIFGAKKCACADFYAFCMSVLRWYTINQCWKADNTVSRWGVLGWNDTQSTSVEVPTIQPEETTSHSCLCEGSLWITLITMREYHWTTIGREKKLANQCKISKQNNTDHNESILWITMGV